jgi:hypothetical protein
LQERNEDIDAARRVTNRPDSRHWTSSEVV